MLWFNPLSSRTRRQQFEIRFQSGPPVIGEGKPVGIVKRTAGPSGPLFRTGAGPSEAKHG